MGLSTSLLMPPSSLATTGNLIELAKVAERYGGIYSTHIRDEGEGVFQAVEEAIDVGKGANIPVDIIHMKIAHKKLWGRVNEIIAMVQKARDEGTTSAPTSTPTPRARTTCRRSSRLGARRRPRRDTRAPGDPGARPRMRPRSSTACLAGTTTTSPPATAGPA